MREIALPMNTPHAEPVLDLAVLAELRELGGVSDPGLADELVTLFLDDAARRLVSLEDALARGERQVLMRAAHTLRSSSSNVGARRVERICAELEAIARDGEVCDAAFKVRELVRAVAAVRDTYGALRRAA